MSVRCTTLLAVVLMPVMALAQTTRPARTGRGMGERGERPGLRWLEGRDNWEEAMKFFRENSPLRAAAFDKLPDDKKAAFRPFIIARYGGGRLARENPQLLELRKKQLHIEDDIFGLKTEMSEDPGKAEEIKGKLKEKVRELVEARMEERSNKINQLKKLVAEEERQLGEDMQRKDRMVERQFKSIVDAPNPEPVPDRPGRHSREGNREGGRGK